TASSTATRTPMATGTVTSTSTATPPRLRPLLVGNFDPGFGNGQDGDLTVSSNTDLNTVRAVASGTAGTKTLSISGVTGAGFQASQVVLIHQTQGTGAGS